MSMPRNNGFEAFDKEGDLEQFVLQAPTVKSTVDGQAVKAIMDDTPNAEGVVVMENSEPVGIVMRTAFFQKMSTLYGHSLYMKRPVNILMDSNFMEVDITHHVAQIGIQAMNREQSKLYDYIIVRKNGTYCGIISIRLFLVELAKRNEAQINVLQSQQQKLLTAHEQEILLRKDLEYRSNSIRNLLNHADQGFLWFGKDLFIKKEYSYTCMNIFHKPIGALSYLDLMIPYFGDDKVAVFQMACDSYFQNDSSVTDNVYLMLLPSDCIIDGKNIHIDYRRIESDGQKAVMVILNDITEKIGLEKAMEEDRRKQHLMLKAVSCQAQIKQMIDEFRDIFSGGYQAFFKGKMDFHDALDALFRSVHTFKGDFAQYGFISASNRLHKFEDALLKVIDQGESTSIADVDRIMADADPENMLQPDLHMIFEVLGNDYFDKSEQITFPKSKFAEIETCISSAAEPLDRSAVLHLLRSLRHKNIKVFLEQYRDYLQYLSNRVMKHLPIYLIEGDDVEIDEEHYGDFLKSLVHVFRNIMDHGIETDEERLMRGKEERGLVECRISRLNNQWFTLCISDDGQGIDFHKIKDKALANGLCTVDELKTMTKDEISAFIFADHFSTKEQVDTLSGRGVGMSAFREACRSLGGEVSVTTEEGKGTSFLIQLPYQH
ncbi:MAG: ATP-binding protein [Ethanoligenens sp.]